MFEINYNILNKRAHRALGHSPEEKVKGHSGAIYRGPLMLFTNIKALVDFNKKILKRAII